MAIGIVGALIASSIIGAAGAVYSASEAKSAQKHAIRAQQEAQRKAEGEARRIAMERRPDDVGATLQIGGTTTIGTQKGSTADFLIPKQASLGGTSRQSGLGFRI